VIVLTAMMSTVLFGVMGLAIEVAGFYSVKRKMQTAADAGAKAGAIVYWKGGDFDTEARRGATQNGYTDGTDGATVTVNHPPQLLTSTFYNNANYVEVIVRQTQNLHLISILTNTRTTTLGARAVGGLVPVSGASIVVLDPTADSAFRMSGGTLNIPGGIQINSNDADKALNISGGSTSITAGYINVTGGDNCTSCTPTPTNGAPPIPDPLAFLQAPTYDPTDCGYTDNGVVKTTALSLSGGTHTIGPKPGKTTTVLCNGITISNSTVTFQAGKYILLGGGFSVSGGSSVVNGTGVSFYNTCDASHSFGVVTFPGGTFNLSAPTSGAMTGILFFQDHFSACMPSGSINSFNGGSSGQAFTGALYFKTQELRWTGGTGLSGAWTMMVVNTLTISGGATTIGNDFSGPVPLPTSTPALVE
jgi:Flp pilus assembly protein TadG